jgi:hypothetical protein
MQAISRGVLPGLGAGLALAGALYAFQRPFRACVSIEGYDDIAIPPDYREKTE